MSETKFTKGKWSVSDDFDIYCGNVYVSYVVQGSKHDAHLIASAPDMYTLLDTLSTDLQVLFGDRSLPITTDINNLLAKARGES